MRKLVIVDYFFLNDKGHDGRQDFLIANEALKQGIETEVLCPMSNTSTQPAFVKKELRSFVGKKGISRYVLDVIYRIFELRRIIKETNHVGIIILISTIDNYFLLSLLIGTLFMRINSKIVVTLRHAWSVGNAPSKKFKEKIKVMINNPCMGFLNQKKNTIFFSDSELIVKDLIEQGFSDSSTLPLLMQLPEKPSITAKKSGVTIGYFGGARFEKGFDKLPDVMDKILRKYTDISFIVQTYLQDNNYEKLMRDSCNKIFRFQKKHPQRIYIFDRPLTESEYGDLMQKCTIILLPYRKEWYGKGVSVILGEAMANGLWAVVPSNSWMAFQKEKYDKIVTFDNVDANEIMTCLEKCFGERNRINNKKVDKQIKSWRLFHNPKTFLEIIDKAQVSSCNLTKATEL